MTDLGSPVPVFGSGVPGGKGQVRRRISCPTEFSPSGAAWLPVLASALLSVTLIIAVNAGGGRVPLGANELARSRGSNQGSVLLHPSCSDNDGAIPCWRSERVTPAISAQSASTPTRAVAQGAAICTVRGRRTAGAARAEPAPPNWCVISAKAISSGRAILPRT